MALARRQDKPLLYESYSGYLDIQKQLRANKSQVFSDLYDNMLSSLSEYDEVEFYKLIYSPDCFFIYKLKGKADLIVQLVGIYRDFTTDYFSSTSSAFNSQSESVYLPEYTYRLLEKESYTGYMGDSVTLYRNNVRGSRPIKVNRHNKKSVLSMFSQITLDSNWSEKPVDHLQRLLAFDVINQSGSTWGTLKSSGFKQDIEFKAVMNIKLSYVKGAFSDLKLWYDYYMRAGVSGFVQVDINNHAK